MSLVVSDTSPLRALHHLQLLSLLPLFFHEIFIPPAVVHELERPVGQYMPIATSDFPFLHQKAPRTIVVVLETYPWLGAGEVEALSLAVELKADALLMDEYEGRKAAQALGLQVTGVVGILAKAKAGGHVQTMRPLMDDLRKNLRFFIKRDLYEFVLRQAGEL